jgi:hypothetical protein
MMLPLIPVRPQDAWPTHVTVTLEDGRELRGVVALFENAPPTNQPPVWTARPRPLRVRGVAGPTDASAVSASLLLRLPIDGNGTMRIGKQTLSPTWIDVPRRVDPDALVPDPSLVLERVADPSRPDPDDPLAYWRWVILADRLDLVPPDAAWYGEPGGLVAEHYAAVWMIALRRLAERSRGLALDCRDLLTHTSTDRLQVFATWVTDPAQLGALLGVLLDFRRSDKLMLESARSWLVRQEQLLTWIESSDGDDVRLAVLNRSPRSRFVKFSWPGPDDIPLGLQITPGVLTRVHVERPPLPGSIVPGLPPPPAPSRQRLHIEYERHTRSVLFRRRVTPARPPGVFVNVIRPPLTLTEVEAEIQWPVPRARATSAQVRRRNRRWEIFFEVRRPPRVDGDDGETADPSVAGAEALRSVSSHRDVRGLEAVTLLVGPDEPGGSVAVITVPEVGPWRLFRGTDDGTLSVHRRSYRDVWYARIVLPDRWLNLLERKPTLFGFLRAHGDSMQVESAPAAMTPWRMEPSRVAIDLTAWDDLPRPAPAAASPPESRR